MIEVIPEDIARYRRSYLALYEQEGRSIDRFIASVAESRAYAQALIRQQRELIGQFGRRHAPPT